MTVRLSLPGGAEAPQPAPRLTRKQIEAEKIANANRKVLEEDEYVYYETPRIKPKIVKYNEDGTIKEEEDSDDISTDEDPAIAEAYSSAKNRAFFYDIE